MAFKEACHTARCHFNAVNFHQNPHKRHHPTARQCGRAFMTIIHAYFVSVIFVAYAKSCYGGSRYNGTRLELGIVVFDCSLTNETWEWMTNHSHYFCGMWLPWLQRRFNKTAVLARAWIVCKWCTISLSITYLVPRRSYNCSGDSEATLKNVNKYWTHHLTRTTAKPIKLKTWVYLSGIL